MDGEKAQVIYFLHDNLDEIFDEKGNKFSEIRKVQWAKEGTEPDPAKGKLEIRNWYVTADGSERAGKGFGFLNEDEAPNALINSLVKLGYGDTKEIIKNLKTRTTFKEDIENLYVEDESESGSSEFVDLRALLD